MVLPPHTGGEMGLSYPIFRLPNYPQATGTRPLVGSGGKQLRILAKDLRQMLAEALRISHARCVVLYTLERHTDTLSSGWFHGADSPYGAVCSIHSIGREVESSYYLHRFSTNHEIRWNQESQRFAAPLDSSLRRL